MYLRHLFPTPKNFTENESIRYTFGSTVPARVSGLTSAQVERVQTLWYRFSCDACKLQVTPTQDGCRFVIGEATCDLTDADRYAIHVDTAGVCVRAHDAAGLLDGIKTLVQLICPEELAEGKEAFYISAADVHDAPAVDFRAVHLCVFPGSTLSSLEQAIHEAGFFKMTHVILEFWGVYPYKCLPEMSWEERHFTHKEIQQLVALARSYGMEVIPMVNHFGHATQSRSCNGRHVVLNKNPRLTKLFEPDGWTWCLSNPDTYKLLAEMRAELIELCGDGSYFHLGFDEAYSFATCDKCRTRVPHELLAEYLNRLTEDLGKVGRTPIIWHDELIRRDAFGEGPIVANGQNHATDKALDLLDRRIIIADWQYDYRNGFNPTTKYFMDKGFKTVVCPWDNMENIHSLSADAKKLGAYGVLYTTWHHLPAFLRQAAYWSNCTWMADERVPGIADTEAACLLRRLYDTEGAFIPSGWRTCEVEF